MALPTFNPVPAPSPGTKNAPKVKVKTAEFGDGYTQETRDGLNHIKANVTLTWKLLTPEQAHAIEDFFVERGGDKPFLYKPVVSRETLKWVCRQWDHGTTEEGGHTFSVTLEQSFSLAT